MRKGRASAPSLSRTPTSPPRADHRGPEPAVPTHASAQVCLAEPVSLHRRYAIKVVHLVPAGDQAFLNFFRTEARGVVALDHPNILQRLRGWPSHRGSVRIQTRGTAPAARRVSLGRRQVDGLRTLGKNGGHLAESGDGQEIPAEKVGISPHALDRRMATDQSVNWSEHRSSNGDGRRPAEGPRGALEGSAHSIRGSVGDRQGGLEPVRGALRSTAVRCPCEVVRHGSARSSPGPP